jgi:cardiolipin synthase
MDRKNVVTILIVAVLVIVAAAIFLRITSPPLMRANVVMADDRDFFAIVHQLLANAEERVDAVLYQSRYYFRFPMSASNVLIADLAEASERGVKVRVILELAGWNVENSEENRDVWTLLRESGVEVYFDPLERTSHAKLVIIDGKYVVVGSSNWSYYSLELNREANVVIHSTRVAAAFEEFYEGVVEESNRHYTPPLGYVSAREALETEERYALILDIPAAATYDEDMVAGFIEFDGATVTVSEGDLDRLLALYPRFFDEAAEETLRILARVRRNGGVELEAVDIEKGDTRQVMLAKLAAERLEMKAMSVKKPAIEWTEASRVVPVPNEKYVVEISKLIAAAEERVWVSMLNAVYYESTPNTARKERAEGEVPSYTNLITGELENAARRGVDVRVIVDVGGRGTPSWGEDTFLEKLRQAGAAVHTDSPETTTHTKLMIVDRDYTVLGSTNWTYHAVEENNESAVIIESGEINQHYAEYIDELISGGKAYTP